MIQAIGCRQFSYWTGLETFLPFVHSDLFPALIVLVLSSYCWELPEMFFLPAYRLPWTQKDNGWGWEKGKIQTISSFLTFSIFSRSCISFMALPSAGQPLPPWPQLLMGGLHHVRILAHWTQLLGSGGTVSSFRPFILKGGHNLLLLLISELSHHHVWLFSITCVVNVLCWILHWELLECFLSSWLVPNWGIYPRAQLHDLKASLGLIYKWSKREEIILDRWRVPRLTS